MCFTRKCITGDVPPVFQPSATVRRLAAFAPPTPNGGSSLAWFGWFCGVGLVVPIVLLGLALCLAVQLGRWLRDPPDMWICKRRARVPIWLPLWAGLTLYFCGSGFATTEGTMNQIRQSEMANLNALGEDLNSVMEMGGILVAETAKLRAWLDAVPNTCMMQNLTHGPMVSLLSKVDKAAATIYRDVQSLDRALNLMPVKLNRVVVLATIIATTLVLVPILPMVVVFLATIMSILVSCLAFFTTRGDVVERALYALQRHGPGCTGLIILLSALWGALTLHLGISSSAFCLAVDGNMVGLAESMSLNVPIDLWNVTHYDVVGAAIFYITGQGINPLDLIMANIGDGVATLDDVRNNTKWLEHMVGVVCPGISEFNPDAEATLADKDIVLMREKLSPTNVWPRYDRLMHQVVCTDLPSSMTRCVVFSLITGFIMVPMLAVMFYVDLKRIFLDKTLPESEDEEETSSEEEKPLKEKPTLSSATYSHVMGTMRHGSHHEKRTFLA